MSGPSTSRLLAQTRTALQQTTRSSTLLSQSRCTTGLLARPFSTTTSSQSDVKKPAPRGGSGILSSIYGKPASQSSSSSSPTGSGSPSSSGSGSSTGKGSASMMNLLRDTLGKGGPVGSNTGLAGSGSGFGSLTEGIDSLAPPEQPDAVEPYHFHIFSHKHNTHVTVTKPDRGAIVSVSTGNLGFRKSRRGQYDAAYQTVAYVLERLRFGGWHTKINRIELVLRGFGTGREAGVKVLMSPEGAIWREKVVRVADATRLKFGGTRSRARRRL